MKCICVCNNVPDTVHSMLSDLGHTDITLLCSGTKVKAKPKKEFLFIFTYHDFTANLDVLNSDAYSETTVFLFCPVITAKSLKYAIFLDVVKNSKTNSLIESHYKDLNLDLLKAYLARPYKKQAICEKFKDFKHQLINNVKEGSLLNPLMTLLYSVKAGNGVKIKNLIFDWLTSKKKKLSDLESSLKDSYEWGPVSKNFKIKLLELLSSDLGKNYKKAFEEVSEGDSKKLEQLAKKYSIDVYEFKYILNTVIKAKKGTCTGQDMLKVFRSKQKEEKEDD